MKSFLKFISRSGWLLINIAASIVLLLSDASVYLDPARYTPLALLGLGFGWIVAVNVFFCLTWLATHHKSWSLLSLLALLVSTPNILNSCSHNKPNTEGERARTLTVLTYNTCTMQNAKKAEDNEVLRYVYESGADVVCLQEFHVRKESSRLTLASVHSLLDKRYPYSYVNYIKETNMFGVAVFSKYPLINKQRISYESTSNQSNMCDVLVDGDTIRLIVNHLESNRLVAGDFALDSTERNKEGVKKSILHFARKMRTGYQTRVPEVQRVREQMDASPYPLLVVGDMNDVPVSYTYHTLSQGLQDAFLQASWCRLGHTFTSYLWGVRIDYIFADKGFTIDYCDTEDVPYSDHLPLTATLSW